MVRCPGQDRQFWKPDDIYEVACPKCRSKVEFWKDDIYRRCQKCGHRFRNPKLDLGCAQWCPQAKLCIGLDPAGNKPNKQNGVKDENHQKTDNKD